MVFCVCSIVFLLSLSIEVHATGHRGKNRGDEKGTVEEARKISEKARQLIRDGKYEEALPLARRALKIREKVLGPDHSNTADSLTQLGLIYELTQHVYMATPLYKRALAIKQKTLEPENPNVASAMHNLARSYLQGGFYSQALPLAEQTLKIREKILGLDHPDTARSAGTLGIIYSEMGSPAQALPLVQRFLQISEKAMGPEAMQTAIALHRLVMVYVRMGDNDRALPLAERAAQIAEKASALEDAQRALILRDLGFLYLAFKEYGKAETCFRRARGVQGARGLVELYISTGKYKQALSLLNTLEYPVMGPQYLAQFRTWQGLALKGEGRLQEACSAFLEAIQVIEELRSRSSGKRTNFFEVGMSNPYFRAYQGMVAVLWEMAHKRESPPPALKVYGTDPAAAAFYFAEGIKARALLDSMTAGAAHVSSPIPSDLADREKALEDNLLNLEAQREETFLFHQKQKTDVAAFQAKLQSLREERQALLEELRRKDPRYAALHYPQPYKTTELPLKPGEIIVEYVLGGKETYIFLVEAGGRTQMFRLGVGLEALEKRLSELCAPFRQSVLRREDLQRFSLAEMALLYKEILAPAMAGVAPGTHLIIVPDGVLGAFPFEALAVEPGLDWQTSVLVCDRWQVTYSQSAAILALNRHMGLSRATSPLFALGDCIYDANSKRYIDYKAGKATAGELRYAGPEKAMIMAVTENEAGRMEFPPLPETRKTVLQLAALFGVSARPPHVLLDVQASETAVKEAPLKQYRYLFFGTHGFLSDQLDKVEEPVLVLSQVGNKSPDDGFLTFSKVLELKLDAELVTLAACMTGVGKVMRGEGALNFARAFQQAGARSVMVTLWNIPVVESLAFYSAYYGALKDGKSRLQAMQAARKTIRSKEPHPYFWSGLILYGEG
jgi:CHAT domain-containing protein